MGSKSSLYLVAVRHLLTAVLLTSFLVMPACQPEYPADVILYNGKILTQNPEDPEIEAMAIMGDRILATGSLSYVKRHQGRETVMKDLEGRVVLPAFVDAHTHLVWSSAAMQDIDLFSATTVDELLDTIEAGATAHPDEEWVRGIGWSMSDFDGVLTKELLDSVVPDRPAYMESADGHSAWVNSLALEAAGIDDATANPEDGIIVRDEAGEATGMLLESAMYLVVDILPPYSTEQVDAGLEQALAEASSYGLTTLIDAYVEEWMLDGYNRFDAQHKLPLRVRGAVALDPEGGQEQQDYVEGMRETYNTDHVAVNAVKLYIDGIIESETAYMLEPYLDGTNGIPAFTDEQLFSLTTTFDALGFQLHAHVIGDGATRQFLNAIEHVIEVNGEADRRPLAAHLEVVDPDDIARFSELGVWADFQTLWAYPDPYITELTIPVIGEERAEWLYPIKAITDAGGTLVAGSDWSVSTMNPWECIEVAVTRKDPWDSTGEVLTPQHIVTLDQMLAAYTRDGARAAHVEDDLGTLEAGKLADLVILDRDPYAIPAEDLSDLLVLETWMEGEVVFSRTEAEASRIREANHQKALRLQAARHSGTPLPARTLHGH